MESEPGKECPETFLEFLNRLKKFFPFSCTKGLTFANLIVYNITVKEKKRIRLKQDHYGVFESDFSLRIKEFLVDKRLFSIPFIDSNLLDCLRKNINKLYFFSRSSKESTFPRCVFHMSWNTEGNKKEVIVSVMNSR